MPHFYASVPDAIARLTNAEAVSAYVRQATVPADEIARLTPQQLNAFPVPGTWSIQQIVVHLMDTDLIAAYRMKRIIAEDRPRLDLYDENAFAAGLHYEKQDPTLATATFRSNRMNMGVVLRALPDAAFDRVAVHPEVGDLPLGAVLRLYIHHVDHHVAFIRRKRAMVESATR
jgi:hypothetical protein